VLHQSGRASAFRKLKETTRGANELFINMNRRARVFSFDLAEDTVAIIKSLLSPD
jgi:hypothetical protein